jgi:phospholipid/cholesterol/gamma-HCH transport system substrate-binding protein
VASSSRLAGIGVFVLGALLLFALGLFMIGDRQMAFADKVVIFTEFKKITGLAPGAIVRVSGAKAGSIQTIVPPNTPSGKFRVELDIIEELHPLVRTDSIASIETEGLVGGNYLGISTGSDTAAVVAPNAVIAGKEPFDVADLMQQMGDAVVKVNATVDALRGDAQRAVVAVADTVENVNELIVDVSPQFQRITASTAEISANTSMLTASAVEIAGGIRDGKGTIGKLLNDDGLYTRITAIAKQTEEVATNAGVLVQKARETLEGLQSEDGAITGMTVSVKQTMDDARASMASFADNMEALKRNFMLRGFYNRRGYFDLAQISPADYREGVLTVNSDRRSTRVFLAADALFETDPDSLGRERLSDAGKKAVSAALVPYLERAASGIVMIEGYAQQGLPDERYLRSRSRASTVRDYLIGTFMLDPGATGAMPLSAESTGSPGNVPWDGVAVAVILPKP